MAKAGEKLITASDFEGRLRILSDRINSVLAGVAYDDTLGEIKNFMIQSGDDTVQIGVEKTVTFPKAFSVAPKVTIGVLSIEDANAMHNTVTVSNFKLRAFNRTSGSDVVVHWIAVGKRI